ncbi:MAG TPA: ABC transporter permease subunit [Acidimicrobiia bacterium]|nr:ABC transporter permease subunit [Acidimicrobiia bacterium]
MGVVRTETVKTTRRLRTYISFGVVIVIPIIMTIALKANPPDQPQGGGGGGLFFLSARFSGLVLPAAALALMSSFLLIIIVAIFGGDAMASDASWGNLRFVLMRPIGRVKLLFAKLGVAAFVSWAAVFTVVLVGLVAGAIVFGWKGLDAPHFENGHFTVIHQSVADLLWHLVIATAYVSWMLTGLVAFTFLLSCVTDSPLAAMGTGVGLYITSQILDAIEPLGSLRYVLPTHYFDAWRDLIFQGHPTSDMARGALLMIGYVLLFTGVSVWWFRRKDILT